MERNEIVATLYMDLLVTYIKVLWILAGIEEKKAIIAMGEAAESIKSSAKDALPGAAPGPAGMIRRTSVLLSHSDKYVNAISLWNPVW